MATLAGTETLLVQAQPFGPQEVVHTQDIANLALGGTAVALPSAYDFKSQSNGTAVIVSGSGIDEQ